MILFNVFTVQMFKHLILLQYKASQYSVQEATQKNFNIFCSPSTNYILHFCR